MAKKRPTNKKHHPRACRYCLVTGSACVNCDFKMTEPSKAAITAKEMAVLLSNAVYSAAVGFCERAELADLIWGSGHHLAQMIGEFAKREMISRSAEWALRTAKKMMEREHRHG